MSVDTLAEAVGVPFRWRGAPRPRTDVCAVIAGTDVRWIARDLHEAIHGLPGEFADEPGHHPLNLAEHVTATTWSLEQADAYFSDLRTTDHAPLAAALWQWLHQQERLLAGMGLGNIVRDATPYPARPTGTSRNYSVRAAAEVLDHDPAIDTGQRRLFDWLLTHGWITRRGDEYAPAFDAITAGHLTVEPRRVPTRDNPWPQIVVTPTGLTELHHQHGGTAPVAHHADVAARETP